MALMRSHVEEAPAGDWFTVTERLALTEDGRVVPEESRDARWLYAIPGARVPMVEAIRYGLVKAAAGMAPPELEPVKPRRGRPPKVKG